MHFMCQGLVLVRFGCYVGARCINLAIVHYFFFASKHINCLPQAISIDDNTGGDDMLLVYSFMFFNICHFQGP